MCPIPGPTGRPGVCPEWTDVRKNTGHKGYTSPFYDNPKGWTRPRDTGKTPISTIQNNQQSFNRLQSKLLLFQTHLSPTCKDKQCNPLRVVIKSPGSMTREPSLFHRYGLGGQTH
jgi:hypothetical protein